MANTIKVSRAQVIAAQTIVEIRERSGKPIPAAVRAIANAKREQRTAPTTDAGVAGRW